MNTNIANELELAGDKAQYDESAKRLLSNVWILAWILKNTAQLDTEFRAEDYSKLKKVYSIWICMNVPDYIGDAISEYGIRKLDLIEGIPDNRADYDKLSVVMICLNGASRNRKGKDKDKGLTGMLNTAFAEDIPVEEKKRILSEDYGIAVNSEMEREMSHMCNLSEGIWERGVQQGIQQGIQQGRLLMRIEQHACGKVAHLIRLKIFGLSLCPPKLLGVLLVEHIPELTLSVKPKEIVYLVATAGGEIEK